MEGLWSKAIKTTGSVGAVAFLIYTILNYLFSEQIVALFGSEKIFILTVVIISALLIILLVAIIKDKGQPKITTQHGGPKLGGPKVTYKDNSTHKGDNNF